MLRDGRSDLVLKGFIREVPGNALIQMADGDNRAGLGELLDGVRRLIDR